MKNTTYYYPIALICVIALSAVYAVPVLAADDYDDDTNYASSSYPTQYHSTTTGTSTSGYLYETELSGSEEVQSVPLTVTGNAGVWFNNNGQDMNYWLYLWSDQEKITAAHLHCGDRGENGPIVVTLYSNSAGRTFNGEVARGDIDDSEIQNVNCEATIGYSIDNRADLAQAIANGDIYVNAHSVNYPAGISRGQLGAGMTGYYCKDGSIPSMYNNHYPQHSTSTATSTSYNYGVYPSMNMQHVMNDPQYW